MFVFLDTLTKIQATTYIKIRSTSSEAARSRYDSEKENLAMEKYQKLLRGEISRKQYVCILSYKYQPLVLTVQILEFNWTLTVNK